MTAITPFKNLENARAALAPEPLVEKKAPMALPKPRAELVTVLCQFAVALEDDLLEGDSYYSYYTINNLLDAYVGNNRRVLSRSLNTLAERGYVLRRKEGKQWAYRLACRFEHESIYATDDDDCEPTYSIGEIKPERNSVFSDSLTAEQSQLVSMSELALRLFTEALRELEVATREHKGTTFTFIRVSAFKDYINRKMLETLENLMPTEALIDGEMLIFEALRYSAKSATSELFKRLYNHEILSSTPESNRQLKPLGLEVRKGHTLNLFNPQRFLELYGETVITYAAYKAESKRSYFSDDRTISDAYLDISDEQRARIEALKGDKIATLKLLSSQLPTD